MKELKMMNRGNLHNYQNKAIEFIKLKKKCALFLEMGLGKTTTTLTAINDLISKGEKSFLVIAPLQVCNTVWAQEAAKWSHLSNLRINVCTGMPKDRIEKIKGPADIYVINRELVPWLIQNKLWRFENLIIDESSSFKSFKSKRFKAIKSIVKSLKYTILLTGTPSPNGLADLWAQMYLLDEGKRLEKYITHFRDRYYYKTGYMGYQYELKQGSSKIIQSKIKDVCISMSTKDYNDLPERLDINKFIELPKNLLKEYKELKKEFILKLQDGVDIVSNSVATLGNKLLQFCNGAVYDEEKVAHEIHEEKLNALKEVIEDNPNENFLVAYNYRSDLERLKNKFPNARTISKNSKEIEEWNDGKIKMLLVHPASAGHGLNLQKGGNVAVWFGLNWNLEYYEQFNARLHRQGQTKPVKIIHLLTIGGIDHDILKALNAKAKNQNELKNFLKSRG